MQLQSYKNLELSAQEANNVKGGKRTACISSTKPVLSTQATADRLLALLPKVNISSVTVNSMVITTRGNCKIQIEWKKS